MRQDEKNATGIHHHTDDSHNYDNPVTMDFRKIHCCLAVILALGFIVIWIVSNLL
jgi:hypothetical protein